MCGICFVCGFSKTEIDQLVCCNCELISRRGPDCMQKIELQIGELWIVFQGSVLWLQGKEPSPQPFVDSLGNILLWNGDVLAGYEVPEGLSDTQYISNELESRQIDDILSFFSQIKGPYAFIYFRRDINRLYFGRDMFGRHSLLWQLPVQCGDEDVFMITSVSPRRKSVQEIGALGVFHIDLDMMKAKSNISLSLTPWSHVSQEVLDSLEGYINVMDGRVPSPLTNLLNTDIPDNTTLEHLKSLPSTMENDGTEKLYVSMKTEIDNFLKVLQCAIQRRVDKCPLKCKMCTNIQLVCNHSKIAVLFSGGLDSAMLALLVDSCLESTESIDLLNVAFAKVSKAATCKNTNELENGHSSALDFEVPDRISGRECWQQLQDLKPDRTWNFVEINVTSEELAEERNSKICHLVAPLTSVLDDSIGCALWFGGRGQGHVSGVPYISPARVLLCGMGADEQLGGYARHRGKFNAGGWSALLDEIDMEISRIHTRNLGRDNRILADHGRAPRFPYLDEDVVSTLNSIPIWMKANLNLPRGMGEKILLRVAASHLGLTVAAGLPKRAIQFGSRIAKLENSKEKGSDSCYRLLDNTP